MDRSETQCKELEERIESLTSGGGKVDELEETIAELQKLIVLEKELLDSYRSENEYYEKLKRDNVKRTESNEAYIKDIEILSGDNINLCKENTVLMFDYTLLLRDKNALIKEKEALLKDNEVLDRKYDTIINNLQESLSRQTWLSKLLMKKRK